MPLNRTAERAADTVETAGGRAAWKPMPVRSIQPQRMYEQIAAELTRLIRERDFKPGDRLPPERELAQQLGVSRPSVREAMIALETAGWDLCGIFHSHPAGPPVPSATDLAQAYYPEAVYLILAPAGGGEWGLRGFWLSDDRVAEVPLTVAE